MHSSMSGVPLAAPPPILADCGLSIIDHHSHNIQHHNNSTPMSNSNTMQDQHCWAGAPDGTIGSVVTMTMLQCVMCACQFSVSGKLNDPRTPVLAVNPSSSIEGPYCIACAGKREGLRSFQIDEARVTLVKVMHLQQQQQLYQQQQLQQQQQQQQTTNNTTTNNPSVNAYAYAASLQQQQQTAEMASLMAVPVTHHHLAAAQAQQSKQDAPGLMSGVIAPSSSGSMTNDDGSGMNQQRLFAAAAAANNNNHNGLMLHQNYLSNAANNNATATIGTTGPGSKRQKIMATSQTSSNPYVTKSTWTDEEDARLIHAVTTSQEQPFTRWSDLAHQLPGRIGKQIRDRWLNHLDPKIDRSPFTRDEDRKLYYAFKQHGKRWVEISTKHFASRRSENHIKNRWYSAAFKKFVKTEIGDDPFTNPSKTTIASSSNASTKKTSPSVTKKIKPQEPPVAEEESELQYSISSRSSFSEEKKEECP